MKELSLSLDSMFGPAQKPHSECHSESLSLHCTGHSRALQEEIKNRNSIYQHKKIKATQKASAFNSLSRKVEVCSQGVGNLPAVTKHTLEPEGLGSLETSFFDELITFI